ncbi:hypothetical protein FACUT_4106 [Fusarium acutatum]|uniref:Uncharacterized protein n=1 Tax=Fusarium acutatum TaxID=78861 RepID=A0A8H4JWC7_9HYPO|nr:hypothetical protein FACUT_4106 [Fusarium acutatum]
MLAWGAALGKHLLATRATIFINHHKGIYSSCFRLRSCDDENPSVTPSSATDTCTMARCLLEGGSEDEEQALPSIASFPYKECINCLLESSLGLYRHAREIDVSTEGFKHIVGGEATPTPDPSPNRRRRADGGRVEGQSPSKRARMYGG